MIQLTDRVYAVEVPGKIDNPNFYRVNNESIMFNWDDVKRPLNPYDVVRVDIFCGDLKDYKWPGFLFTTKTATEEQSASVVQIISNGKISGRPQYRRYDRDNELPARMWTRDSRHSLETLLRSKGLDPDKNNFALIEKESSDDKETK